MHDEEFLRDGWRAIYPHLVNHTAGFLVRTARDRYDLPSSGTLISVADRWFVATAGHTIPRDPNSGNIFLLSTGRRYPFQQGVLEFRKHNALKWPDVGYLELDPDQASKYFSSVPCPVERLAPSWHYTGEECVALVGCSQQLSRPVVSAAGVGVEAAVKPLFTYPIDQSHWPAVPQSDPPTDGLNDIFLDFRAPGPKDLDDGEPCCLRTLKGYSGGGVWNIGLSTDGLWSTDQIRLVGIQSRWHPQKRYARVARIDHWLKLIHQDYPALRCHIDDCFPASGRPHLRETRAMRV